jgi:hypothetical protein
MTSCTQRRDWRTLVAAALVGVALGGSGVALGQTCKTLGPQSGKASYYLDISSEEAHDAILDVTGDRR